MRDETPVKDERHNRARALKAAAAANNGSWWKTFATEFFKLSGGPGNVPTCAEQALTSIAGEFVPISPGGAEKV